MGKAPWINRALLNMITAELREIHNLGVFRVREYMCMCWGRYLHAVEGGDRAFFHRCHCVSRLRSIYRTQYEYNECRISMRNKNGSNRVFERWGVIY